MKKLFIILFSVMLIGNVYATSKENSLDDETWCNELGESGDDEYPSDTWCREEVVYIQKDGKLTKKKVFNVLDTTGGVYYVFKQEDLDDKPLMYLNRVIGADENDPFFKDFPRLVNGKRATTVKSSTIKGLPLPKEKNDDYYCVKDYKETIYCFTDNVGQYRSLKY